MRSVLILPPLLPLLDANLANSAASFLSLWPVPRPLSIVGFGLVVSSLLWFRARLARSATNFKLPIIGLGLGSMLLIGSAVITLWSIATWLLAFLSSLPPLQLPIM
jgi:hypothetical protein